MFTAQTALRDLSRIQKVDPLMALKLIYQREDVENLDDQLVLASKTKQVEDDGSFHLTVVRTIINGVIRIGGAILSIGGFLFKLLARVLSNPYVLAAVAVGSAAFGIFSWLNNKVKPASSGVMNYPDFGGDKEKEALYLQSKGYKPGTTYADLIPKTTDYSKHLSKSPIIEAVIKGANIVGVDPALMLQIVKAESAFGLNTRQSASSAKGIFQIIDSTWAGHYPQFNSKYGIPVNSPLDPLSASIFSAAYVKDVLTPKLGYPPSATDVYLMYVFGPAGGANIIREYNKNPMQYSALVQGRKPYGPGQIKANKDYFYDDFGRPKTLAQTYAMAKSRTTLTQSEEFILSDRLPDKQQENPAPPTNAYGAANPNREVVKVGSTYIEVNDA